MKFYVKDAEGNLVEATQDQVLDSNATLYNAEGEALRSVKPVSKEADHVKKLEGMVAEIAKSLGAVSDMKEEQEKINEKLAAYDAAMAKGFPMPGKEVLEATNLSELDKIIAPYNLAKQGKDLVERARRLHNHIIPEETRQEMAKFYCLFLKAGVLGDPFAKVEFDKHYAAQKALFKANATDLGDSGNVFPVPDIVESEILHFARESSVLMQEARIWPMTSEVLSIPLEGDAVTGVWGNTTTEDTPNIGEVELTASELSVYSAVKNATLADARSDIVSWMTDVMAEACGQSIDSAGFVGTGTPCSGIFLKAGYSVVMASTSTAFSSITASHLSDMISKLDGLKKQGAKFYMHGSILHFIRNLVDDNNRPIFIETVGAPMSGTIWGYPYREVITSVSTSAVSTGFVAFCNLKYFGLGRRLDATALQVDPYGLWTTNRTRFKIYQRWALSVAQPNGFVKLVTAGS